MMEHKLPRDNDDATLWEGDELTVRFLLEEGKLNLCMRLMKEYKIKQAQAQAGDYAAFIIKAAKSVEMTDVEAFKQRLLVFEQSLGVLLKCALEHVEAVQTTDLPELVDHVHAVLTNASAETVKQ